MIYAEGVGVPKDDAEAEKWYRKAAEQGFPEAQYNLGVMYEKGAGVRKNAKEAVKWFRKAAEQGLAVAQLSLGIIYTRGGGVRKNSVEAYRVVHFGGSRWQRRNHNKNEPCYLISNGQ